MPSPTCWLHGEYSGGHCFEKILVYSLLFVCFLQLESFHSELIIPVSFFKISLLMNRRGNKSLLCSSVSVHHRPLSSQNTFTCMVTVLTAPPPPPPPPPLPLQVHQRCEAGGVWSAAAVVVPLPALLLDRPHPPHQAAGGGHWGVGVCSLMCGRQYMCNVNMTLLSVCAVIFAKWMLLWYMYVH